MMRVYLAAPYAAREQISECATQLTRIGFTVTSSWLKEEHEINEGTTGAATALPEDQVAKHATDDLRDIDKSDLLVAFTVAAVKLAPGGSGTSGGRHVETGYALGKGLPILVVGEPENVFHKLPRVTTVPDWHEAVVELGARLVAKWRDQMSAEATSA